MKPSLYGVIGAVLAIVGLYLFARGNYADDGNLSGIGVGLALVGAIGVIAAIMLSQRQGS